MKIILKSGYQINCEIPDPDARIIADILFSEPQEFSKDDTKDMMEELTVGFYHFRTYFAVEDIYVLMSELAAIVIG